MWEEKCLTCSIDSHPARKGKTELCLVCAKIKNKKKVQNLSKLARILTKESCDIEP